MMRYVALAAVLMAGLAEWMLISELLEAVIALPLAAAGLCGIAAFFNWISTGHVLPRGPRM